MIGIMFGIRRRLTRMIKSNIENEIIKKYEKSKDIKNYI